ncbi:MAG: hypothetical protein DME04_15040 [Candidatus Rokuibacteriota bacterium]|nr:MAG: hypothetical protein DME04_15040 [Candidatus Rokubacteria bacterium]
MRTLFVISGVPLPLNVGGNHRPYHMLRALAGISDVSVVCAAKAGDDPRHLAELRAMCHHVFPFPDASFRWHRDTRRRLPGLRAALQHLDPFEPALLKSYHSAPAATLLRNLAQVPFDLVWIERIRLLPNLPPTLPGRVILDLDDLEHRKLAGKLRTRRWSRSLPFDLADYVKLRALERSLARRRWEVVVCSDTDRQALGAHPRVSVVPNGVDLPAVAERAVDPASPTFVFVGAMFYAPNVDAVRFFAREILPRIRRQSPRARFVVVGRDPHPEVAALHDGDAITVTGTVDDVAPYLRVASVAVVPIRFGSGTRIKILEAFAHRVPVVSTTFGAEGLDVAHGRELLLADDPEAFAAACTGLAGDRRLQEALTERGHDLVRHRYQWHDVERQVQALAGRADDRATAVPGAPAHRGAEWR